MLNVSISCCCINSSNVEYWENSCVYECHFLKYTTCFTKKESCESDMISAVRSHIKRKLNC